MDCWVSVCHFLMAVTASREMDRSCAMMTARCAWDSVRSFSTVATAVAAAAICALMDRISRGDAPFSSIFCRFRRTMCSLLSFEYLRR